MCTVLLAAPVALLMGGVRFYLLAVPTLGLVLLWNDNDTLAVTRGVGSDIA
jgi:hypothetical protein